jgi:hypothetical protein
MKSSSMIISIVTLCLFMAAYNAFVISCNVNHMMAQDQEQHTDDNAWINWLYYAIFIIGASFVSTSGGLVTAIALPCVAAVALFAAVTFLEWRQRQKHLTSV